MDHVLDLRFQFVRVLAQAHRAGHARAALDGVQVALHALRDTSVGRLLLPLAQVVPDAWQQVGRFFEEDWQQVGVDLVDVPAGADQLGLV